MILLSNAFMMTNCRTGTSNYGQPHAAGNANADERTVPDAAYDMAIAMD